MRFAEIEAVVGFALPKSAYAYPAWWANDATGHTRARAWLGAGWQTEDVEIGGKTVTLTRSPGRLTGASRIACMKGTAWLATGTDMPAPLGAETLAGQGELLSE